MSLGFKSQAVFDARRKIEELEKKLLVFYAYFADKYYRELISNAELASFVLRVEEPNLLQNLRLAEQQQSWEYAQVILQALGDVYDRIGRKPEFRVLRQRALKQIGIHLAEAKAKGQAAFNFWTYLRGVDAKEALAAADLEGARVIYQEILDELTSLNDPSVNDKIAVTYQNLGILAQEQRRFDEATAFYQKSLQICEDAGDLYNAASAYHQLGMLAQEQRRFDEAINYYQKAFEIREQFQNWRKASSTLSQWGNLLETQEKWSEALQIYIHAFAIDLEHNEEWIGWRIKDLGRMLKAMGMSQFESVWQQVTGEECPEEVRSAIQAASEENEE
ncbi:MAG: tetratricopeptide repeat protein [Microcoleus sp. SIO2G3]|nr:tetratricopeptide repeat protein [Microcoleus sp. SIO2G3]